MTGIHTTKPFKTFTENGFPDELVQELERLGLMSLLEIKCANLAMKQFYRVERN